MKYFTKKGDPLLFKCPCGKCDTKPTKAFLDRLDEARDIAGVPFVILSGPRCAAHNEHVGGAPGSDHLLGEAVDIRTYGSSARFAVMYGGLMAGITRIGINKNSVHLGIGTEHIQRVAWLYP